MYSAILPCTTILQATLLMQVKRRVMRKIEFFSWLLSACLQCISLAMGNPISAVTYICTIGALLLHLWFEIDQEERQVKIAKMLSILIKNMEGNSNE